MSPLVLFSLLTIFTASLYSQTTTLTERNEVGIDPEKEKPTLKERISFTPSIGWLHSWSDFKKDGFMPSFLQGESNELGYGINVNFQLNRYLSISTGVLNGELEGAENNINTNNAVTTNVNYGRGVFFKTDIFEFTLPRFDLNLTELIFRDKVQFFNKASIGIFASHGLVYYDSKVYAQENPEVNLIYTKEKGRTGKTTEGVTSFGGNFQYKINEKFDVGLESSIRNVHNDKLDAWTAGDYNDKYSYTAVTVTYHLNRFKRNRDKKISKVEPVENKPEIEQVEEIVKKEEVIEDNKTLTEIDKEVIKKEKIEVVKETEVEDQATKVEDKNEEEVVSTNSNPEITGYRYYVVVEAYKGDASSTLMAERLEAKGENPVIIRNLYDTWNLVTIGLYPTKAEALEEMRKARQNGFDKSWVHILPPVKK